MLYAVLSINISITKIYINRHWLVRFKLYITATLKYGSSSCYRPISNTLVYQIYTNYNGNVVLCRRKCIAFFKANKVCAIFYKNHIVILIIHSCMILSVGTVLNLSLIFVLFVHWSVGHQQPFMFQHNLYKNNNLWYTIEFIVQLSHCITKRP